LRWDDELSRIVPSLESAYMRPLNDLVSHSRPPSMDFLTDPHFWARWVRIVVIDLVLAGDNAVLIALAVRSLPPREQTLGRIFGTLGAMALRVLFVFVVTQVLRIPFLRLAGGVLLVWIAVKLVRPAGQAEGGVRMGTNLYEAIGLIALADVVMSLDNVIAIAIAARGDLALVIFGLMLSLPLVVWGSGLLARLMSRAPAIIWLGGGVLGFVAMDMILSDANVVAWLGDAQPLAHRLAPAAFGVAITALGWWFSRDGGEKERES
jgi:YjbE family integral membrane protein